MRRLWLTRRAEQVMLLLLLLLVMMISNHQQAQCPRTSEGASCSPFALPLSRSPALPSSRFPLSLDQPNQEEGIMQSFTTHFAASPQRTA